MARAVALDPYQSSRFIVRFSDNMGAGIEAGFTSISLPEVTVEHADYREGTNLYSQKYPVRPVYGSITLSKGVTKASSGLYKWIKNCIEGKGYRANILIDQFHRTDIGGFQDFSKLKASRRIECWYCLPVRYKPGTDLDANSSEISIEEIEFEIEFFVIKDANGKEIGST